MSLSSNAAANGLARASEPPDQRAVEKKRNVFPDRLLADPEGLDRLRTWVDQATAHFEGAIKLTRNDVANAVLALHAETLSLEELSFLWKRCFNPVRFLKSTAAQVQKAQERGESVTLDQVIDRIRKSVAEPSSAIPRRKRRTSLSEPLAKTEEPGKGTTAESGARTT